MTDRSVAIRLGTTGAADVRNDFRSIGDAGEAEAKRLTRAMQRAGEDSEAAAKRYAAATAKLTAVNGGYTISSDANAQVLAFNRAMADQQRRAESLRAAIDPLRIAQQNYDAEVRSANSLFSQGAITQTEHAAAVALASRNLKEAEGGASRYSGAQIVLQSVIRKSTDQFAAGASWSTIFAEHLEKVAEVAQLYAATAPKATRATTEIGEGAAEAGAKAGLFSGALAATGEFLAGPWGIAVSAGVAVVASMAPAFLGTSKAAEEAAKSLDEFEKRQADMARFIDATTGKLKEQNRTLALIAQYQAPMLQGAQAGVTQGFIKQGFAAGQSAITQLGEGRGGPSGDALAISRAFADAKGNVVAFNNAVQAIQSKNPVVAKLKQDLAGFAGQANEAGMSLRKMIGDQADLNTRLHGGTVETVALIDKQVAYATATSEVERAQLRLNDVKARGAAIAELPSSARKNAELKDYQRDLTAATTAISAAQQAEKNAADAVREHKREMTEAAAAAKRYAAEIKASLADLVKIDPADAATAKYRKQIEDIARLVAAGPIDGINDDRAATYRLEALRAWGDAEIKAEDEARTKLLATLGPAIREIGGKSLADSIDLSKQVDLIGLLPGRQLEQQKKQISSLADFYQQAFDGGSGSIWTFFQRQGEHVLAELLAQWTITGRLDADGGSSSGTSVLSGLLGRVGGLFSGAGPERATPAGFTKFASGTEYASGGMAYIAENGPELVDLPRGSRVTNAADTRRLLSAANDGAPARVVVQVQANDYFDARVSSISGSTVQAAAPAIAAGGAQLGTMQMARARRRRLGTR